VIELGKETLFHEVDEEKLHDRFGLRSEESWLSIADGCIPTLN
jgi:hypothetical protein